MTARTPGWDLARIRAKIAAELPIVAALGLEVVHAVPGRALVRLDAHPHILRPGGVVAGPALFAMADVAGWAAILAERGQDAVTANATIHFLRGADSLPLLAEARPLRAGKRVLVLEVLIYPEAAGPEAPVGHATMSWAALGGSAGA